MKLILINLLIILSFSIQSATVDCPEFETTLESILKRIKARDDVKELKAKSFSTPQEAAKEFKKTYTEELKLKPNSNRDFMSAMEKDAKKPSDRTIYFDVENSVQKKLNDQIFGEKTMVDAVNSSFMKKFYENVQSNPQLKSRISGEYKDYKSFRLRLSLKDGDKREEVEALLNGAYKKAVDDFSAEYKAYNLENMSKVRTDEVAHPERWFLAGTGEDALEANMAARGARSLTGEQAKKTSILNYKEHVETMSKDVREVESLRLSLASNKELNAAKILDTLENGTKIPSKDMINILRKYKPSDFANDEAYIAAVKAKVKNIFGKDVSDDSLKSLINYQKKVDAISPPLFTRERVEINLEEAKEGIVSVDFTGIGVDNLYQQMSGLSKVNYGQSNNTKMLKEAFNKLQGHVDEVTEDMNKAKRYFTESVQHVEGTKAKPLFSGDDGIYMPETKAWTGDNKTQLVSKLSQSADPSKYRVTFVKSKYPDGSVIPDAERSKLIVRAESLEKKLREEMVGIGKFSSNESKKLMTAIDFTPNKKGGKFEVIIGGKDLNDSEKKLIEDIVKKVIKSEEGEVFGGLIIAK